MKNISIHVNTKSKDEDDSSTVSIEWSGSAVPDLSDAPPDEDYGNNLAQWDRINNLVHSLVAELEYAEFGWKVVVETS